MEALTGSDRKGPCGRQERMKKIMAKKAPPFQKKGQDDKKKPKGKKPSGKKGC